MHQPMSGSISSPLIWRGPMVLPSVVFLTGRPPSVGVTRQVVAVEHRRDGIVDVGADLLVAADRRRMLKPSRASAGTPAGSRPGGRQQVDAAAREDRERAQLTAMIIRHHRSVSSMCERMPTSTSSTMRAGLLEGLDRMPTAAATRGRPGRRRGRATMRCACRAIDRPSAARKSTLRRARTGRGSRSRERGQRQRGVRDGAGDRPFGQEGRSCRTRSGGRRTAPARTRA